MNQFDTSEYFKSQYIKENIEDNYKSTQLAKFIDKAIEKIDESLSYQDFATAIGMVLKDQYGSHNFDPFIKALSNFLNSEDIEESATDDYRKSHGLSTTYDISRPIEMVRISYTDFGTFYGVYIYYEDGKETNWDYKINNIEEANKFLSDLDIVGEFQRQYNPDELDTIVSQLNEKGIEAEHADLMDVSENIEEDDSNKKTFITKVIEKLSPGYVKNVTIPRANDQEEGWSTDFEISTQLKDNHREKIKAAIQKKFPTTLVKFYTDEENPKSEFLVIQ